MSHDASSLTARRVFADDDTPPFSARRITEEPVGGCALCGGQAFEPVAAGYDYEMQTCGNRWHVRRCQQCTHQQLDPRPAASTLPVIYPSDYYSYEMEKTVGRLAMWGKTRLDRLKLRAPLAALGHLPDGYLDVGCGDGRYLGILQSMGVPRARLFGLELDERAVARARAAGYHAWQVRAEHAGDLIAEGSLDMISLFHVIEHVADPVAVIDSLVHLLRPGGVIVVETPNVDSLDASLFRDRFWGGYHFPRHWHLFSERTLRSMLERAGLQVRDCTYQTGHAFWLYSLHHALKYRDGGRFPRLARWVHPLHSLPALVAATGFDFVRARLGCRTSAVMAIARKPAA